MPVLETEARCSCGWRGDADHGDDHDCSLPSPSPSHGVLTADTITDEQIYELLALVETALGRRRPRALGDKARARARCAEILSTSAEVA